MHGAVNQSLLWSSPPSMLHFKAIMPTNDRRPTILPLFYHPYPLSSPPNQAPHRAWLLHFSFIFFSPKPSTTSPLELHILFLQTENHLPYNSLFPLSQTKHYLVFILTCVEHWSVKVWHVASLSLENNRWSCIQSHLLHMCLARAVFNFRVAISVSSASLYTADDRQHYWWEF